MTNTPTYHIALLITAVSHFEVQGTCDLYDKSMMIVNDDSIVINKLEASLTDDARVIIYDRHMFIVQANEWCLRIFTTVIVTVVK